MTGRLLLALLITVALEVPVVAACYPRERLRMALTCLGATTVTNLAMNGLLLPVSPSYAFYLLVGETAALVLEAAAYVALSRGHEPGRAALASALANSLSFGAGLLLWG